MAQLDHRDGRQQWQWQRHGELHHRRQYVGQPTHRRVNDAGVTVTVTQAGACAYTIAPTTQSVLAAGGAHSAAVTTTSGCGWTSLSNNTSWISVTGGSSGAGNGTVSYIVDANPSATPAHRDADDRWCDGDGDTGRGLRLQSRTDHKAWRRPVGFGHGGGHHGERLRLDRRQ